MSYATILPQPPEGLEIDIMLEKRLQEAWSQRKQASIERLSDFIRFILLRQSSLPPKVIPRRQILRGLDHASIMLCGLSYSKNNIYNMRDFVFERLITSIAIFMKKEKLFAHDFHDKNINQAVMHCIYDDRIEHRFAKRFFAVFFKSWIYSRFRPRQRRQQGGTDQSTPAYPTNISDIAPNASEQLPAAASSQDPPSQHPQQDDTVYSTPPNNTYSPEEPSMDRPAQPAMVPTVPEAMLTATSSQYPPSQHPQQNGIVNSTLANNTNFPAQSAMEPPVPEWWSTTDWGWDPQSQDPQQDDSVHSAQSFDLDDPFLLGFLWAGDMDAPEPGGSG